MKKFTKIFFSYSLSLIFVLGIFFNENLAAAAPSGAGCNVDSTVGNLKGYILSDRIDGPIYLSTESWNDPIHGNATSTTDFYVNYDRNSHFWSGRAWHSDIGWIEFNSGTLDKKAFVEDAISDPQGWGYWDGMIDLSDVQYSTNSGSFIGTGYSFDYTGNPNTDNDDVFVGLGELDFSHITFIESPCNEYVDLFLNSTPNLHFSQCNSQIPVIKWTSTNIQQGSCSTDVGFWNNPGSRADSNTSGEQASQGLNTSAVELFRIKCIGAQSESDVYGVAALSCGTENPIDANSIIVPIVKEA